MKIQIYEAIKTVEPSERVCDVISKFLQITDAVDIAPFLDGANVDGEDLDLSNWIAVLGKFDDLLEVWSPLIPVCCEIEKDEKSSNRYIAKRIVCSILRFRRMLLKTGKEKRFFASFEHVGRLMSAYEIQIAELAVSVLFYACLPSASIATYTADIDWKESAEVPNDIAKDALIMFESLGFLAADNGLMDYIRGHEPDHANHPEREMSFYFPGKKPNGASTESGVDTSLTAVATLDSYTVTVTLQGESSGLMRGDFDEALTNSTVAQAMLDATMPSAFPEEHMLSLLCLLRAVDGLKGDQLNRIRVTCLRMQCLLIVAHSRIPPERLQAHLKVGSPLLKDLLALCDISSEPFTELQLPLNQQGMVALLLECAVGLLESSLRRRGNLLHHSGILIELGLSRAAVGAAADRPESYDAPWVSIVMAATSAATATMLDVHSVDETNEECDKLPRHALDLSRPSGLQLSVGAFHGEYIRSALELFAACLTQREARHVTNDTPIIGAIVALAQSGVTPIRDILTTHNTLQRSADEVKREDLRLLWPVAKALACLEMCFDQNGYYAAFRECDGLATLASFIEIFGANAHAIATIDRIAIKSVIEDTLSLLCRNLDNARRGAVSAADSGVQILYQQNFSKISQAVFQTTYKQNEFMWIQILMLVKAAINTDPAFLRTFLSSPYAADLASILRMPLDKSPLLFHNDAIVMPIARLALSMCITIDGQAFVLSSRMLSFVLDSLVHPSMLMPSCEGLSSDTVTRCGRVLAQLARDCEQAKQPIRDQVQTIIHGTCAEARRVAYGMAIREEPNLNSARMQVLQKIANICIVVENMSSDSRRHGNDLLREILTEEVLEALVRAFHSTLPPSRQLFCQLSMRHSGAFPHFGYHPTAKALTSLLKTAAGLLPQLILPVLFRAVDDTLGLISASKQALRSLSTPSQTTPGSKLSKSGSSSKDTLAGLGLGAQDVFSPPAAGRKNRARSRGSSFGQPGANVLTLGVLDCIPHRCIFDADFVESELDRSVELEKQTWYFMCAVLNLEWLSIMLCNGLRPMQRAQGPSLVAAGKDVFRRLFAFQRSSLLEVCRFSSSKWTAKPLSESRSKRGLLESFAAFDSSEDTVPILRVPKTYSLRVVNLSGALIREECEIEGSRVVLLASVGATCSAFERGQTTAGVIRYRTAHGWLSEYRRDHQREPIVELLELPAYRLPSTPDASGSENNGSEYTSVRDPALRKVKEAMTLRESASAALVRVHTGLRQVAVYLSRLCHVDAPQLSHRGASRGTTTLSTVAPLLSGSLSKILRSFLSHPLTCLEDNAMPASLSRFNSESSNAVSSVDFATSSGLKSSDEPSPTTSGKYSGISTTPQAKGSLPSTANSSKSRKNSTPSGRLSGKGAMGNASSGSNSFEKNNNSSSSNEDDDESSCEVVSVTAEAVCLYQGAVVRYILTPILEDRNGHLNTYILRALSATGAIDAFFEAMAFVLAALNDAIKDTNESSGPPLEWGNFEVNEKKLSATGRCALHALTNMLALVRKLVHRELYLKSPITASMADLVDDLGPFFIHDLLYKVLSSASKVLWPAYHSKMLTQLPSEIQQEWLSIIGDLVTSMQVALPEPPRYDPQAPDAALPMLYGLGRSGRTAGGRLEQFLDRRSTEAGTRGSGTRGSAQRDGALIAALRDMGFEHAHIAAAMAATRSNSMDVVMEFLISHPMAPVSTPAPAIAPAIAPAPTLVTAAETHIAAESSSASAVPPGDDITAPNDSPVAPAEDAQGDNTPAASSTMRDQQFIAPLSLDFDLSALAESGEDPDLIAALQMSMSDNFASSEQADLPMEAALPQPPPSTSSSSAPSVAAATALSLPPPPPAAEAEPTLSATASSNNAGASTDAVRTSNGLRSRFLSSQRGGGDSWNTPLPRVLASMSHENCDAEPFTEAFSSRDSGASEQATQRDYARKCDELVALASAFRESAVENVLEISASSEDIGKWSTGTSHTLIPQLSKFLTKIYENSGSIDFYAIVCELARRIRAYHSVASSAVPSWIEPSIPPCNVSPSRLYGTLHLLLCLLRNSAAHAGLEKNLTREFAVSIAECLIDLIEIECRKTDSVATTNKMLPSWISPACVVIFELITSTRNIDNALAITANGAPSEGTSKTSDNKDASILTTCSNEKTTPSEDEKTESFLAEEKTDDNSDSFGKLKEVANKMISHTEHSRLIPSELWVRVYRAVMILVKCASGYEGPASKAQSSSAPVLTTAPAPVKVETMRLLDPEGCQGALLILSTLLTRQSIASSFVADGGVHALLALPLSSRFVEAQSLLTIVVHRCMETRPELRQQALHAIRSLFKDANDGRVSLEAFLNMAVAFLCRSPEEFMPVVLATVRFTRRAPNAIAALALDDDPMPQEITVELLPKEVQEEKLKKIEEIARVTDESEDRAEATIRTLMEHLTCAREEPANQDPSSGCMFTKSDVLDALSDCTISLRRLAVLLVRFHLPVKALSHLVGKNIHDPFNLLINRGDSAAITIADFILNHYFPLDVLPPAASPPAIKDTTSPIANEIRSASRLLVALSTHKGSPRRLVLNGLLQALRLNSVPWNLTSNSTSFNLLPVQESTFASKQDEENDKSEDCSRRLCALTRLASLVTIVVKASGAAPLTGQSNNSTHQQVSVDTVHYLMAGGLHDILTTALASVPLGSHIAGDAINSLIQPLEMMTRPKLLAHIERLEGQMPVVVSSAASVSESSAAVQMDAASVPGDSMSVQRSLEAGAMVNNQTNGGNVLAGDRSIGVRRAHHHGLNGGGPEGEEDTSMRSGNESRSVSAARRYSGDVSDIMMDFASVGNTNERTSYVVYDGSDASATLPSEGLFEDDEDEDQDEDDEENEDDDVHNHHHDEHDENDQSDEDEANDNDHDNDEGENPDEDEEDSDEEEVEEDEEEDSDEDDEPDEDDDSHGVGGATADDWLDAGALASDEHNENAMMLLDDFARARGGGDFFATGPVLSFVTPPDQIRHDPFRALISQLQREDRTGIPDSPEAMVYNLLRTLPSMDAPLGADEDSLFQEAQGLLTGEVPAHISARLGLGPPPSSGPRNNANETSPLADILPGGVERALQVRLPGAGHPLLAGADGFGVGSLGMGNVTARSTSDRDFDIVPGSIVRNTGASFSSVLTSELDRIVGRDRSGGLISSPAQTHQAALASGLAATMPNTGRGSATRAENVMSSSGLPPLSPAVGSSRSVSTEFSLVGPGLQRQFMAFLVEHALEVVIDPESEHFASSGGEAVHTAEATQEEEEGVECEDMPPEMMVADEGDHDSEDSYESGIGEEDEENEGEEEVHEHPDDVIATTPEEEATGATGMLRAFTDFIRGNTGGEALAPAPIPSGETAAHDVEVTGAPSSLAFDLGALDLQSIVNAVTSPATAEVSAVPPHADEATELTLPIEQQGTSSASPTAPGAAEAPVAVEEASTPSPPDSAPGMSSSGIVCPPGYESDVFYSLPEDMQREISDQHNETSQQIRQLAEAAGYDYETIIALPESIRQEILDQARRDHQVAASAAAMPPPDPAHAQEMDNASFLISLPPELRAEVLLTADPAFIATLPPELVAEAQLHRERAALQWQQREVSQTFGNLGAGSNRQGAAAPGNGGAAGGAAAALPIAFHEFIDEEEVSEDEDDETDAMYRRTMRALREAERSQRMRLAAMSPVEGLLVLSSDEVSRPVAPSALIPVLVRLVGDSRVKPQMFYRLMQNITKNPQARDHILRLLVGILGGDTSTIGEVVSELTHGLQSQLILAGDCEDVCDSPVAAAAGGGQLPRYVKAGRSGSSGSAVTGMTVAEATSALSHRAALRIISILNHLVSGNVSTVYDILRPRVRMNGRARPRWEVEKELDVRAVAGSSDEALTVASSAYLDASGSTESLLESLVILFSRGTFSSSASDLAYLTTFINDVSGPLEFFLDKAPSPAQRAQYSEESKRVATIIPPVGLARDSLRCLCDVLLSDLCTKTVFDCITRTISRLARVSTNRDVLTDLISEVVLDLAMQSELRLQGLLHALVTTKTKRLSLCQTAPTVTASASATSHPRLTACQLPLGEAGGRQHERLLRAIQTQSSVAEKTGRKFVDILPANELGRTWMTLESVLTELRSYLSDDGEERTSGARPHSRPQSAMVSLVTRLLPTIEAFFSIHVSGILVPGQSNKVHLSSSSYEEAPIAASIAEVGSAAGAAEAILSPTEGVLPLQTTQPTSARTPLSALSRTDAEAASEAETETENPSSHSTIQQIAAKVIHQATPGERYRNTPAYAAWNQSLVTSDGGISAEDRLTMQRRRSVNSVGIPRTSSLQPQLPSSTSLTRTSSSHGGVNYANNSSHARAQRLLCFVQTHNGILNLLIRARPALLDHSFSALVRANQLRSSLVFDNKRRFFFSQMKKMRPERGRRSIHLQVRRNQVFEDSFHQLRMRTGEELRGRLQVNFHGEEGVDAGGLTREWYLLLSREIFNPNYALFSPAVDGATFQPNPLSMINNNHLDYFKFVGRVIGKAICDGHLMDAHFTRSFYKHVLGNPVEYNDIEAIEPDYYKSLKQILEYPLEELGLELTFSADTQTFGRHEVVDLIPNGRNVPVTDDNKSDYVRLVAHHRMTAAIRSQIESFLDGFYELVPPELISIFSPTELELLICGLPEVDIEELCTYTDYSQYRPADQMIVWFWDVLRSFTREERALFLQFVTGTSKVPLEGFANLQGMRGVQRFSIHKAYGDSGLLPTAHTCFNQLDLPVYTSQEELREKLLLAIKEGSEGFGFA